MKNKVRMALAIIASMTLWGCEKEFEQPQAGEKDVVKMAFDAMSPAGTRTALGEPSGGTAPVLWTVGDRIAIWDGQSKREFVTDIESPSRTATFTGEAAQCKTYSAMYPYSAVTAMDITGLYASYEYVIPTTQEAVSGSFDPAAHISYAISGTDRALHFHNAVGLVKLTVPAGSWSSVTLRGASDEALAGSTRLTVPYLGDNADGAIGGSASATATASSVTLKGITAGDTFYIAVAPVELKKGFTLTFVGSGTAIATAKTEKAASVAAGHILDLGVPPIEEAPAYTITGTSEISSLNGALTEYGITGTYAFLVQMMASSYLTSTSSPVEMVDFTYSSLDPFGLPDIFSARLYILKSSWQNGASLSKLVLANHGTVTMDSEAPTSHIDPNGILAWGPTAVVVPDYYGFGSTYKSGFQAYLHRESTARECLDAMVAARKLLNDKKITTSGCSYYNVGYSQGGHTCIANLRYLVEHPGEYDFDLTTTFAGAGPYDIPATYSWMMSQKVCNGTFSIPLSVIAMNLYEQLELDYSKVFKEPLLSKYSQWVLSRNYSTSMLTYYLGTSPSAILTEGIMGMSSEEAVKLQMAFEKNSLVSGWTPSAGCKVTLFHSTTDDIVPELNSEHMYSFLKNAGVNVTLTKGDYGTHLNAATNYALNLLPAVY